ncbi:MAG TPA: type III pantothenate kinase [Methylomirabilota bacterium]|nr:type III pantothenate kinase [Methylomirabilota bacterium]
MLLLVDIGNTHTHVGLQHDGQILRHHDLPTSGWDSGAMEIELERFVGNDADQIRGAAFCSVVPRTTPAAIAYLKRFRKAVQLTHQTVVGVGIDYPQPATIGADRLANAVAAKARFGAPAVVVDFGTAVTFDVVNSSGNYVGGIIAPGLSAMTDYLHEKTALLPRIQIRDIDKAIGKSTEEAMLIGAVHGYRGLVKELILELKSELNTTNLPVIATGGYAALLASRMPEITAVDPFLTLEGLRLVWESRFNSPSLAPR